MTASIAVAVQCFVKTDTLQGLLESLLRCDGHNDVNLFIWQDSARGSRREADFASAFTNVQVFVIDFIGRYGRSFRTIDYRFNERNLGPCATCKIALDYVFKEHDFAILVEDDVVLSSDALRWFSEVQRVGLLDGKTNWAIAGQSIFFDAREKVVDQGFVAMASELARQQNLANKYTVHQFVPSSCFATTRRWWAEFGSTRGEPRGDVLLCERTKEEGRGCVFPIVPRAKDVGMLHDYGYSVMIHTKEGVQAITNSYLLAEDLLPAGPAKPLTLERFEGDAGLLFRQTTLLEGYALDRTAQEELATAANDSKDWKRAAALWDGLREDFPDEPRYWLKAGEAFSEARMIDRAERVLDEAVRLFPGHNWIAYRHIRVAHAAEKWLEALRRADRLRQFSPDFWPGWVAGIDALAMLHRAQEAEDLADQSVVRFPDEFWPNYWLTRLRAARSNQQEALRIWADLVNRFPGERIAFEGLETASATPARRN